MILLVLSSIGILVKLNPKLIKDHKGLADVKKLFLVYEFLLIFNQSRT
jgi:hypothetical protein